MHQLRSKKDQYNLKQSDDIAILDLDQVNEFLDFQEEEIKVSKNLKENLKYNKFLNQKNLAFVIVQRIRNMKGKNKKQKE